MAQGRKSSEHRRQPQRSRAAATLPRGKGPRGREAWSELPSTLEQQTRAQYGCPQQPAASSSTTLLAHTNHNCPTSGHKMVPTRKPRACTQLGFSCLPGHPHGESAKIIWLASISAFQAGCPACQGYFVQKAHRLHRLTPTSAVLLQYPPCGAPPDLLACVPPPLQLPLSHALCRQS